MRLLRDTVRGADHRSASAKEKDCCVWSLLACKGVDASGKKPVLQRTKKERTRDRMSLALYWREGEFALTKAGEEEEAQWEAGGGERLLARMELLEDKHRGLISCADPPFQDREAKQSRSEQSRICFGHDRRRGHCCIVVGGNVVSLRRLGTPDRWVGNGCRESWARGLPISRHTPMGMTRKFVYLALVPELDGPPRAMWHA